MRYLLVAAALLYPAPALAHVPPAHVPIDLHPGVQCPASDNPRIVSCYREYPIGQHHIYWTDGEFSTLAHELGHVFSAVEMGPRDQDAFLAIFGLQGVKWTGDLGQWAPEEWFAEAYDRCWRHTRRETQSSYGYAPTRAQHLAACRTIWNADRTRGQ